MSWLVMSAGTLLYVAVFEVMGRERGKKCVNGLVQLLATIVGFITMMTIDMIGNSDSRTIDQSKTC